MRVEQIGQNSLEPRSGLFSRVSTSAEILSYLPLCQTIRLAAYTQRPKARESDPIDTYILDLKFTRRS